MKSGGAANLSVVIDVHATQTRRHGRQFGGVELVA
jgi:hypothetical protein